MASQRSARTHRGRGEACGAVMTDETVRCRWYAASRSTCTAQPPTRAKAKRNSKWRNAALRAEAVGFVFHDPNVHPLPRPSMPTEADGSAASSPRCAAPPGGARPPGLRRPLGVVRDPDTGELLRLVMECVEGPTIDRFLSDQRRRGRLPLPEATVRANMHEKHIAHRDIKPEKILISDHGRTVKTCNFGLVMSMPEAPPYEPGASSLWYMASELLLEKADYGVVVDAWQRHGRAHQREGAGRDEEGQLREIFDVAVILVHACLTAYAKVDALTPWNCAGKKKWCHRRWLRSCSWFLGFLVSDLTT
ncbi:hypothetical protein HU200_010812 [Digitaria exilis]|uniref:[RNA-polymerase]-subunit kinase n=1 Tax=Digitaria exilis TaxID=1010633 RepID=A0A835KN95_9POAL|nr:hypothetical protein HU200_010812 [Digitaria exilis]